MKYYHHYLLFLCISTTLSAQTPGGVKYHHIWFEGERDAGMFMESGSITPLEISTATPTDSILFYSNLNFYSGTSIHGSQEQLVFPLALDEAPQATVYTVYLADDSEAEHPLWNIRATAIDMRLTTKTAATFDEKALYAEGATNVPVLGTYTKHWKQEQMVLDSLFSVPAVTLAGMVADSLSTPFTGRIAEFIFYDRVLKTMDSDKIETYLALKYGISLKNKDYLSTDDKNIWDHTEHLPYAHRIAGLGRDDATGLYQKQSNSTELPGKLIIALDSIALSNKQNAATIQEGHFLIWGDNNDTLEIEQKGELTGRIPLWKRKWALQATGAEIKKSPTLVQLDARYFFGGQLLPKDEYLLVVDRSGEATYEAQHTEYIVPNAISPSGMLTFKDLFWDTDGSGQDHFTFTTRTELSAELIAWDEIDCDRANSGKLIYQVLGGVPPYTYTLRANGTGEDREWDSNAEKEGFTLTELSQGDYTLSVTDSFGSAARSNLFVESPKPLVVDLGDDKRIIDDAPIFLDAGVANTTYDTSYEWVADHGLHSSGPKITILRPGTYTVTARNAWGCIREDQIRIFPNAVQDFMVVPNTSLDGKYTIMVQLQEPSKLKVIIYDINGRLMNVENKSKGTYFEFNGAINGASGVYTIYLETKDSKKALKFIKG